MRRFLRLAASAAGVAAVIMMVAVPALASTVTNPSSEPYTVTTVGGTPQSFTIQATGYAPGILVYAMQCDGKSPAAPGWSPTIDCDNQTSTSGVTVAADGSVTFPADDLDFGFFPIQGQSPGHKFNCIGPSQTPLSNGQTNYTNCSVRIASQNNTVTADQAFRTLSFPNPTGPDTPEVPFAVLLPLSAAGIGAGFILIRKRRSAQAAA